MAVILGFLRMVPSSVWFGLLAAMALAGAVWAIDSHGYDRGAAAVQAKWDRDRAQLQAAIEKEKQRQAQVVERVVIEYRDRVKVIKEKGDAIVREVPVYVSVGASTLPPGWRVLHDAAAAGVMPDDPARAVGAAEAVDGAAAAETVAANYATCRTDQARLEALQRILKETIP